MAKPGNEHAVDAIATLVTGGTEVFFVRHLIPIRPGHVIRLLRVHHSVVAELVTTITGDFSTISLFKPTPEAHGTLASPPQIGMDTIFNQQNAVFMHRSRSNLIDVFRQKINIQSRSAVAINQFEMQSHWSGEYDLLIPELWVHLGFDYEFTVNATEIFTRVEFRYERATPAQVAAVQYEWGQDPKDREVDFL